jgi:hypothetical protein
MTGNINPRFARAIYIEEQKAEQKEALKRAKIARERESGSEIVGTGLWPLIWLLEMGKLTGRVQMRVEITRKGGGGSLCGG